MATNSHPVFGALLVRGVALPLALVSWAVVIVLALLDEPHASQAPADALTHVLFSGIQ